MLYRPIQMMSTPALLPIPIALCRSRGLACGLTRGWAWSLAWGLAGGWAWGYGVASPAIAQALPEQLPLSPGEPPQPEPRPQPNPAVNSALRPGDRLRITVVGFPDLSGEQTVMTDGTIQIPMAGHIAIAGLTTEAAVPLITQALLPYVRRPQVGLTIIGLSPIRISVTGAVIQPGPRLFTPNSSNSLDSSTYITLSDAILLAGGVRPNADLRQITLRRVLPAARPSASDRLGKTEQQIDLWQAIQTGDLSADLRLQDGDEIFIPTAPSDRPNQQTLLSSTVAPSQIVVQVAGAVQQPGQITIAPSAGVSAAVAAAGGLTDEGDEEAVALYRLDESGQLAQQQFNFGDESDPLENGDLIIVGKNSRDDFFGAFGRVVSPLSPILSLLQSIFF